MLRMSRIREFDVPTYMFFIVCMGLINGIANRNKGMLLFFLGLGSMAVWQELRAFLIRVQAIKDERAMGMQDD